MRWDLTGRPPFRSEVLSHPSVNVSVESGTEPRFGFALPAVLVHGVVTRRFTVDLTGAGRVTRGEVPARWLRRVHRRACPARNSVVPLGRELGARRRPACCAAVLAEDDDDDRAAVLDAALRPARARAARRVPRPARRWSAR